MIKKILIVLFLVFSPLTACSTLSEINERVKGDGVPYIPGIWVIKFLSNFLINRLAVSLFYLIY